MFPNLRILATPLESDVDVLALATPLESDVAVLALATPLESDVAVLVRLHCGHSV